MLLSHTIQGWTFRSACYAPVVLLAFVLLTSCDFGSGQGVSGEALLHGISARDLTADILLHKSDKQDGRVQIVVHNPSARKIRSIRAWVKFDPGMVKLGEFNLDDDRFSLLAPGENGIDNDEGILKFGGATPVPVSDANIILASFNVRKTGDGTPMLIFYDWRADGSGHTAVLTVEGKIPVNIISSPSPLSL